MIVSLKADTQVILLDVEGTTTHVDFVYKVLFPYARAHLREFLAEHGDSEQVRRDLLLLRNQHAEDEAAGFGPPPLLQSAAELDSMVRYVNWLMDRDSKDPGLKSLQGKIWEQGYQGGELQAHVFPDVPVAMRRWRDQQKKVCIFSSGSVLAQKQLFVHTVAGDLTAYIDEYFDTGSGNKRSPQSYQRIAGQLQQRPESVVFISDTAEELDAAQQAGVETILCVRPGNRSQPMDRYSVIHTFDEILLWRQRV
ncbi:MAG: acireductone synthase [Acidobacteria bacterium]|nr:MAG: acireductone synthase [Acidobacteriota bacterium]